MEELLNWMEYIEDVRQAKKVRHKLKDILVIVLFATLADADDWVKIAMFAKAYQDCLRKYIGLENGVPSHDTIDRVVGLVSPEILQQLYGKWQELLNRNEGEALKKIICIDGQTMRSNKCKEGKPSHIVSAWSREDGSCLGQRAVSEKNNEITAIPELLDNIQIKGQIITIDAMGTQKAITENIRKKRADYVLALKRDQTGLYEDVVLYFGDMETRRKIKENGGYKSTTEKAHRQIEKRGYYQTDDIRWLSQKKEWKDIKSIGMEEKTITDEKGERKGCRYYISSLVPEIETFRALTETQ